MFTRSVVLGLVAAMVAGCGPHRGVPDKSTVRQGDRIPTEEILVPLPDEEIQRMSTSRLQTLAGQYQKAVLTRDREIQQAACALDANDNASRTIMELLCHNRMGRSGVARRSLSSGDVVMADFCFFLANDRGSRLGRLVESDLEFMLGFYRCRKELKRRGVDVNDLNIEPPERNMRELFPPLEENNECFKQVKASPAESSVSSWISDGCLYAPKKCARCNLFWAWETRGVGCQ